MSTVTLQTCDKCGAVVPQGDPKQQFWEIGIQTACRPQQTSTYRANSLHFIAEKYKMELCRPCIEDLGLVPSTQEPAKKSEPDLLEIFREIISNEIVATLDEQ